MSFAEHSRKNTEERKVAKLPHRDLAELANSLRLHLSYQAMMGLEWLPAKWNLSRQDPAETLEMVRADLGECNPYCLWGGEPRSKSCLRWRRTRP